MPFFKDAAEIKNVVASVKSILIIGPATTGKTRSLVTLAKWLKDRKLGKLYLFDLDGKGESLIIAAQRPEYNCLDHIVLYQLQVIDKLTKEVRRQPSDRDTWLQFEKDFNSLHDMVDPRTGLWKSDAVDPPGAVIVDSLSRYDQMTLEYAVASSGHDIGAAGTDARNDYGASIKKVEETIDSLKSLPCITGWMAHDTIIQDAKGQVTILPNVTGKKFPSQIARKFNIVLFSMTEPAGDKVKYKWQTAPKDWVRTAGVTSKEGLPLYIDQDFSLVLN